MSLFEETPGAAVKRYLLALQKGDFDGIWKYCYACQEAERKIEENNAKPLWAQKKKAFKDWAREADKNSGKTVSTMEEFAYAKITILEERKNEEKLGAQPDFFVFVEVEYPSYEKGRIDSGNKHIKIAYYKIPVFAEKTGYEVGDMRITEVIHF